MTQENRVQVELLGETFTVKGEGTAAEIQGTGGFLNEQLNYLSGRCPGLNAKNLALLTAFNLASELLRVRRDYEALAAILDKQ
ncbi:MAG: cell division protein ZapA [Peptococcaceae bacterium]|jgi:cell division protein ZapA|nr:cell division protein ZapA [Peptococcaceae bacterium]